MSLGVTSALEVLSCSGVPIYPWPACSPPISSWSSAIGCGDSALLDPCLSAANSPTRRSHALTRSNLPIPRYLRGVIQSLDCTF